MLAQRDDLDDELVTQQTLRFPIGLPEENRAAVGIEHSAVRQQVVGQYSFCDHRFGAV